MTDWGQSYRQILHWSSGSWLGCRARSFLSISSDNCRPDTVNIHTCLGYWLLTKIIWGEMCF